MNYLRAGKHLINLDRVLFVRDQETTDGMKTGAIVVYFGMDLYITLERDEATALMTRLAKWID